MNFFRQCSHSQFDAIQSNLQVNFQIRLVMGLVEEVRPIVGLIQRRLDGGELLDEKPDSNIALGICNPEI